MRSIRVQDSMHSQIARVGEYLEHRLGRLVRPVVLGKRNNNKGVCEIAHTGDPKTFKVSTPGEDKKTPRPGK